MKEYLRANIPTPRHVLIDPKDIIGRLAYADELETADGHIPCNVCNGRGQIYAGGGCDAEDDPECDTCDGEGRVPNYYGKRAQFIRAQINHKQQISTGGITPPERGFTLANIPGGSLLGNILYHNGIYRNGFLFNVGMPVLTFLGLEECHCGRKLEKMVLTEVAHHCDRCRDGKLIMSGLAKPLFENHPIEEMEFTDLDPLCDAFQGPRGPNPRYGWFNGRTRPDEHYDQEAVDQMTVPNQLWHLLTGYIQYGAKPPIMIKWYKTDLEAKAALSRAAIQFGRTLAGLPSLT